MSAVSALTGQSLLLAKILQRLENKRPTRGLLKGPPGSGKSWLLERLRSQWIGKDKTAILASGDPAFSDRPYATLHAGLSQSGFHFESVRLLKQAATESAGLIRPAAPLVRFLVDALLHWKERQKQSKSQHLIQQEHDILFHLENDALTKSLLLIADDLQYWDRASLRLLTAMLSQRLIAVYPFLKELHVIAAITCDEEEPEKTDTRTIRSLLTAFSDDVWTLDYVTENKFPSLFTAFGLHFEFLPEQCSMLYSICGGHLELAQQLVKYYNSTPASDRGCEITTNSELDLYSLLHDVAERRLTHLGARGREAKEILGAASILGRRFTRAEIKCLLHSAVTSVLPGIETALQAHLLREDGAFLGFSHEAVQRAFMRATALRAPEYHDRFAKCLAILRPFDYITRAEHLLLAGQEEKAAQLYFVGLLNRIRSGLVLDESHLQRVRVLLSNVGYADVFHTIVNAYELFSSKKYAEAARALECVENIYPDAILAERDYLFALCKLKVFTATGRKSALDILNRWAALRDAEPEIWARIEMTRMVAFTHLGDLASARSLDQTLARYYSDIRRSDPSADAAINVLRRNSACLYGAEVAANRCRLAVSFFGPTETQGRARNPSQYYMALCNLSGNLLVTGAFMEARETARLAVEFWSECRTPPLPRLEVALNNLVVSGFLSGDLSAFRAREVLKGIKRYGLAFGDSLLFLNNYVTLAALTGDLKAALRQSKALYGDLCVCGRNDTFYRYFIGTNLAALQHLTGHTAAARKLWDVIEVPDIPDSDREFLVARHVRQREALRAIGHADIEGWDAYLQRRYPTLLGPAWRFYGRGFLFSDIQFWSES